MFNHVQAAWSRTDITSPIQQIVLLFLAEKANDSGVMWWSIPSIAKACRASEKTVRVALKELHDLGVIGSEEQPRSGITTRWIVSDDPAFLFKTPVMVTRVRKAGRKPTPVMISDGPGNGYQSTPVMISETPVTITDKAVNKQPSKQPVNQPHSTATAHAVPDMSEEKVRPIRPRKDGPGPLSDPAKEAARVAWFAALRERFTALARHEYSGAATVIRAACEQYGPDAFACWSALIATSQGDYIGPHLVAKNIGGWRAAGKPSAYALWGRKNGATNGPAGIQEASGFGTGTNKYRASAAVEADIRESSRRQRTSVSA